MRYSWRIWCLEDVAMYNPIIRKMATIKCEDITFIVDFWINFEVQSKIFSLWHFSFNHSLSFFIKISAMTVE